MTGNFFAALPVRVPADWFDALRSGAPEGLRWFHRDDLHVTLAFFGREDPGRVPALREVLARIPIGGGTATPGPLRLLPTWRRFSALAFEVADGRDELAELIATWRGPLREAAGVSPDRRPSLPHLTVARPIRKDLPRQRRPIAQWARSLEGPAPAVEVLAPALYGWSPDRPRRQFRVIP